VGVGALIPVEEYLRTSYSPDREFIDGVLVERNVGEKAHALLQARLALFFGVRRKQWNVEVLTELRIEARPDWFPIPDVCVYPAPAPEERFPSRPPLLWIEILSADDTMIAVWNKARQAIECGTPYVWIIDPNSLTSGVFTAEGGPLEVPEKTLPIPGTPIVVPLLEVVEE
jgi:Uma2 family endonuclease